jgi:hypothetical protein
VGVAAEAGEERVTALDGVEQVKSRNGSAGAVGFAIFVRDDDCGTRSPFDDP